MLDLPEVASFQEGPGIMAADFCTEGVPLVRLSGLAGTTVTLDGCDYLNPAKVAQKCEGGAVSVSWLTATDELADGANRDSGPVEEEVSSSDSRFGGIPMPNGDAICLAPTIQRVAAKLYCTYYPPDLRNHKIIPGLPAESHSALAAFSEPTGKMN